MFRGAFENVVGVDEAGRGPLAGPVVAAAVAVEGEQFKDCKKLSPKRREELFNYIIRRAVAVSISAVPSYLVDILNIRQASLLAMRSAIRNLNISPSIVLIDGRDEIPALDFPQVAIVHGDETEPIIGAASIVAKVARDMLMNAYSKSFPHYGFGRNKGYPTKGHYEAIRKFGETIIHRLSYRLR